MNSNLWIAVAATAVAAGGAVTWFTWPHDVVIRADDPHAVAEGRSIYASHCASCHGERLEGQAGWQSRKPDGKLPAPPHDASGHTWHHPDRILFEITKFGVGRFAPPGYATDMPAYEGALSDAEIAAVLAYIKSTWPPEIRAAQERLGRGS